MTALSPAPPPALRPAGAPGPGRAPGVLPATLVLAGVLAVFFAPALVTEGQFLHFDSGRLHHPLKAWLAGELQRGRLPQWNPWGGLGYPMVSAAVDAVLHPLNVLLLVLPFEAAFKAWVLLSLLAGGAGSFFWARQLGNSYVPALGAGIGFVLSGFLVSSTDNLTYLSTLAALPWMLGAAHAWLRDGGPGRLALLGAASALAAAAGDPQGWGFATAALPVYGVLLARADGSGLVRGAARGALASLACGVAAAPFVLPVLAWLPHSTRGEPFDAIEYERFNLLPLRTLELILPGVLREPTVRLWSGLYETYSGLQTTPNPWVLSEYVGASTLFLAFLGAARGRAAAVLLAFAGVALWIAMGSYAGFGQLARLLPVVGGFRYWEKAAAGVHLLVPMAAAFGIAALAAGGAAARGFTAACSGAAALLLAGWAAASAWPAALASVVVRGGHHDHAAMLAGNLARGALHAGLAIAFLAMVAFLAARAERPSLVAALAVVVVACDLGVGNAHAYQLHPLDAVRPEGPIAEYLTRTPGTGRVITPFPLSVSPSRPLEAADAPESNLPEAAAWVVASRSLASGFSVGRVGNFEAYTGMVPARQMRFRRRAGLFHQLPAAGLWSVAWVVVPGHPARARVMGLQPPYRVVAADDAVGLALVEVPHRPRTYLAAAVESVDRRGAMEFVLDPASVTSARTVVEGSVPPDAAGGSGGTAAIVVDEPERVAIDVDVEASGPALLVLNDMYAPGWRATVDGAPAEIHPANYLARGVWAPPGRHRVEFRYRTPGLLLGSAVAALGGAVLAASAALARARRRRERGDA